MFQIIIDILGRYKNMPSNAVFLILLIAVIFQLPAISQDQKYINQEPISERLNSQFDELHPVISPDGQFLFYTIRFHPKNIGGELDPGDIWISELKSNSEWSKPENAGELWNNTGYNILFKFFASGQKALLLTQNEGEKPTLAISSLINNNWSEPRLIKIQSYYNRSGHLSATISEDGEVLILSMESFGSLGYEDLYVSFRENDSVYSEPVILGGSINTTFQEMTPYLSGDGLTLYFASNGHGGYGGRDIFASKRLDETWGNWSRPVNLGPGVNSQGIELSFFETNWHSFAYVSSTQNSRGMGDIFRMSITDSQFQLVAANSNQPKIARPQQIEAKAEIEKVELEKSEQEEAQVVTKAVEVVSEEKVTVVAKREVFEGQALTTSKDINLKQSANLTKSDRNLASVVVESSSAKVSGRILSSNTRKPLSASIKFENNENAFTDSEGNFDILISKNQRRKAWVTAEGMKPLQIEISDSQLFPEFYLDEIGTLSSVSKLSEFIRFPSLQMANSIKMETATYKSTPKLQWTILDEDSREALEVSWKWVVKNQNREEGKTMNDGIIVLAGDGLISSRLILEAPGYKRQEVEIRNDLLNDQVIYLSEGISGNMKLQNLDFITSNSSPQLQDLAITKFANISKANQPFTISVFDAIGMNISNFRVVGKENIQEGFKIDIQNGIASFSLPNSLKPDKLKVISSGYFPQTIQPADWEEGNHLTINLEKIEIGTEFILSTLEFEQSTISFTDSTVIEELDRLADMLLNTNGLEIQLTGYTDNQGLVRENMELSTERATAVKNYLIAKGVEAERIEARGLGSANPIASNQSPETRKLNRRVEVAITKIGEE